MTDERFWSKVDRRGPDECWPWVSAFSDDDGYGRVKRRGRNWGAHRYAWTLTHGAISRGLVVCHRCDNPPCCNPGHLFLGTPADNKRDSQQKQRHAHGVRHGRAKLTEADVTFIRVGQHSGIKQKRLGQEFGVNQTIISDIVRGELWPHTLKSDRGLLVGNSVRCVRGPRQPPEVPRLDLWKSIALSLRAYHLLETA